MNMMLIRCKICFKEFGASRPRVTCSHECFCKHMRINKLKRDERRRENKIDKVFDKNHENQTFRKFYREQLIEAVINGDNENVFI